AAAGLRLLTEPTAAEGIAAADAERWRRAQTEPTPRLVEGRLAAEAGVRCGGDLSDGLLADAARTTDASGCAAELWLDVIPVDAALPRAFPSDWVELALGGGEDFELLLAVPPGDLLALHGELGAGKTTLVRGLAAGLGGDPERVASPTFVLHHVYRGGRLTLHHVDLFRLGTEVDLALFDLDDLLEGGAVVVEWAELADLGAYRPVHIHLQ